jgi:hypothetical protein
MEYNIGKNRKNEMALHEININMPIRAISQPSPSANLKWHRLELYPKYIIFYEIDCDYFLLPLQSGHHLPR